MADEKKDEVLELVAIERGFSRGRLVEPGTTFPFRKFGRDGKERKLPKWAQLAGLPMPKKTTLVNGDLKPKDAQEAVKAKAGALAGNAPLA